MSVQFEIGSPRAQQALESTPYRFWHLPNGTVWAEFRRISTGYLVRFPALADFSISADGGQVLGWPALDISEATLEHLFLNQVHPLAVSAQGKLVMHASAVCISNGGIAFVGESGRGKSTLATSFATEGTPCITDDGLVLEDSSYGWAMMPGPESVRLWDDARSKLLPDGEASTPVQYTVKGRYLASKELLFSSRSHPAARFYFLGDGSVEEVSIRPMPPAEALIAMVRNTFLMESDRSETIAAHFENLHRLAGLPIHFSLDYPRRYDDLPGVRDKVMKHVSNAKPVL
jgi:hypothetical protein